MGGQHWNSIIPGMLFHLHKGKGWRKGGRRRGKSVPARGSSESSRQRLPAASPAPIHPHPSPVGAPRRHRAALPLSRLKQLIWLMKANHPVLLFLPAAGRAGAGLRLGAPPVLQRGRAGPDSPGGRDSRHRGCRSLRPPPHPTLQPRLRLGHGELRRGRLERCRDAAAGPVLGCCCAPALQMAPEQGTG